MSFASFGLSEPLVRALKDKGYTEPTPIQAAAIPVVLSGRDVLAGAQTGTGKTAGFCLPILELLSQRPMRGKRPIRALIITPTRELAAQVEQSVKDYGTHLGLKSMVVFGGVKIGGQIHRLKSPVDILVATPGRLLDHVNQGTIKLHKVQFLVLDEADRMLDMGFIHDIKKIIKLLPVERQSLMFSATFAPKIKALADSFLKKPELIEVARQNAAADTVEQKAYLVDRGQKRALLEFLIKDENWHQVLVFARTRHGANRLCQQLNKANIPSLAIHGDKSQGARTRALKEFKAGKTQVLVATDVAARGIDIHDLPHVVNYDLPNVPEDYVHRIGRTGRAGSEGEAASLVCADEYKLLADIEKLLKRDIPKETLPGFMPLDKPSAKKAKTKAKPRRGGKRPDQKKQGPKKPGPKKRFDRKPKSGGGQSSNENSGNRKSSKRTSDSENSGNRKAVTNENSGNRKRVTNDKSGNHKSSGNEQNKSRGRKKPSGAKRKRNNQRKRQGQV